ncbi:hypothetical protein Moror_3432 [Moniliophthora roreri MCA 2997]|uniref:Protein kinase domain-containing protein n=2 Tax=Moniliophthora roreri TaxID=221103 RepID=V2X288_MONRO|nr:hypothetical protein Moror_3432 [Moniliophthora roreri MCA 2997]
MCLHEIRDDSNVFNISVGDKIFRTKETIHREFESDLPRVWAVRELGSSIQLELETIAKIKTRLEGDARYAHFPNVCAAGLVPRSKSDPEVPDSTINESQLAFESPIERVSKLVHYRIVYEELSEPLPKTKKHWMPCYSDSRSTTDPGVGLLREAGYIHRNIHPENIVLVLRKEDSMCRSSNACPEGLDGLVPVIISFEHAVEVDDPQTQNTFQTVS